MMVPLQVPAFVPGLLIETVTLPGVVPPEFDTERKFPQFVEDAVAL
jgi:hypothetical protein